MVHVRTTGGVSPKCKDKWNEAQKKSVKTSQWAETMAKAIGSRLARRWRFVSFRGKKGGESRGIVDVIAIRRNMRAADPPLKRGDLFDIILIQVKGGTARRPTDADVRRLRLVGRRYKARSIVLFEWEYRRFCRFSTLARNGEWQEQTPVAIFA